jgi:uncharacterized protein (TIGR00290 family)
MHPSKKAALLWSGGKDSALALYFSRQNRLDVQVVKLVTCVSQAYDRVSMHGVRRRLIEEQADELNLPIEFVVIPHEGNASCPMAHSVPGSAFPSNDTYTRAMLEALHRLKAEGIEVIVFGDIFLADLRAFRDQLLNVVGLEGCYPLWGRDTGKLLDEFNHLGFRGVIVCVDTKRLPAQHCGQLLTPAFRDSLPDGVDPCGERGEYHTFIFDGPFFRQPIPFRLGEIHLQDPFAFQELLPEEILPKEQVSLREIPAEQLLQ